MPEPDQPEVQIDLFRGAAAADIVRPARWSADAAAAGPAVDPYGGMPGGTQLYRLPIVALDFETTGLAIERGDAVCEIGLVAGTADQTEVLMSTLVNPGRPLSAATRRITGIDDRELFLAPRLDDVMPRILELIGSTTIVMHNAPFDLQLLMRNLDMVGSPKIENLTMDTLLMARFLGRTREGNSLRHAADYYGIRFERMHRAAEDAKTTALVYHALVPYLELRGVRTVGDLVRGRMAGSARLMVSEPSSFLLDLATRAAEAGTALMLVYAPRLGGPQTTRRVRARFVEDDRYLIGWDLDVDAERTYRLDRILSLSDGQDTYVSPWAATAELK